MLNFISANDIQVFMRHYIVYITLSYSLIFSISFEPEMQQNWRLTINFDIPLANFGVRYSKTKHAMTLNMEQNTAYDLPSF
ncbi:hypothetical protein RIF29_04981 [Crotalaria pallida]|uniref:Uncharacterized protein n=1 Tax=Crotalaria pallida TaxID=3830 RepID=A0AAN9P9I6_CROPI